MDECVYRFGFYFQYLSYFQNRIRSLAKFLARRRTIDLMIFDLIGVSSFKTGNNDTHFVVYQDDFKEILMKQPIAFCLAEAEEMLHLTK